MIIVNRWTDGQVFRCMTIQPAAFDRLTDEFDRFFSPNVVNLISGQNHKLDGLVNRLS